MGRIVLEVKDFSFKYRQTKKESAEKDQLSGGRRKFFVHHRLQRIREIYAL